MITKAENKSSLREECLELLAVNKYPRVLDVGGAMFPWAREVVTHYFDLQDPHAICGPEFNCPQFKAAQFIKGDICRQESWNDLRCQHARFDFAICSHTLEDVRDPSVALRNLPRIARAGFIAVPVKYRELSYTEGHGEKEQAEWGLTEKYRGYCHHRWIFTVHDGKLKLFPKLAFVEKLQGMDDLYNQADQYWELGLFWEGYLPFEFVNGDFLGPNPPSVFDYYRQQLRLGL